MSTRGEGQYLLIGNNYNHLYTNGYVNSNRKKSSVFS